MLLLAVIILSAYYVAMKRFTRHLRVAIVTFIAVLIGCYPVMADAETATPQIIPTQTPSLIITEFQTNGGSAAQEFIELYNTTDQPIDLSPTDGTSGTWKLQFFSAASVKSGAPNWSTTTTSSNSVALRGRVAAHDYFILASAGYLPGGVQPDQVYDATSSHLMTDTGGGLQLLHTQSAQDRIMWLPASSTNNLPSGVMVTPPSSKSLQRIPDENGEYLNASPAAPAVFSSADTISPATAWQPPLSSVADGLPQSDNGEDQIDGETTTTTKPSDNAGLAAPQLTELLPNPAAPLTDAADEFIELYNPNTAAFNLRGYVLQTGTATLREFAITTDTMVPAESYVSFYAVDTKLSLTNSGGQVRLLNPLGQTVSQTAAYGTAADGASWSLSDGLWQWSTTSTPDASNVIVALVAKSAATKPATTLKSPVSSPKKVTATKAKGTTTTKKVTAKKTTTKKSTASTTAKKAVTLASSATTKPKPPIHSGMLVAVGVAAVLYGLYEYRHDIANKFAQRRGDRSGGRSARSQAAWR